MDFSNLDINGVIALGVGALALANTIAQIFANSRAKTTAADVVEVKQKQAIQEIKIDVKLAEERTKMQSLLDDVLNGKRK